MTTALRAIVRPRHRQLRLAASVAAVIGWSAALACGGAEKIAGVAPVASVSVLIGTSSLVVGTTAQATAITRDAAGSILAGRSIAWSSTNTEIASVSSTGEVTALRAGTAEITASSEGIAGSAPLSVTPPPIHTISVTVADPQLRIGTSTQASAVAKDDKGNVLTDRPIVWTTDNAEVATVSDQGVVTGVKVGTAKITATSEGKSGSASVSVALVPIHSITVSVADPQLRIGSSTQASAVAKDDNGNVLTDRPIVWTTDNAEVATVSDQGVVTGVKVGTAKITATSEGKSGSASVSVELTPIHSITVSVADPQLRVAATTQATAVAQDENGNVLTGRTFVWTTDNAGVATVTAQGVVTGVKAGTASITATSEGKSGSATITVFVPVATVIVTLPQPGLSIGFDIQASDTIKDADGNLLTGRAVTWSSSNTAVATVTQSGLVTGVGAGSADIIATSEGKTGSATIGIVVIKQQSLSAGSVHTCAISGEGDAYCWGYNTYGQLGDGTTLGRLAPVRVAGGLKFSAIASKSGYTYALTSDGRLVCWGACPGSPTLSPRQVETKRAIYLLGSGTAYGDCAIGVGKIAYCWGDNSFGQLGTGSTGGTTVVPDAPVTGNHAWIDIATGEHHACAITDEGKPYCWGYAVLGNTNQVDQSSVPKPVAGTYTFKDIASGIRHSCGLNPAGAAYCWGSRTQVGVPREVCDTRDGGCSIPVAVEGGYVFESISSGVRITCGLSPAGDPYCWGQEPYIDTPISFRHWSQNAEGHDPYALVKYRTVSTGNFHVCATSAEGDIYCMNHQRDPGNRTDVGHLGDGTTDISRAVRKVIGGIKFRTP